MAATFSYAQAAKGMSSSVQSSNAPSGTATPSKETTSTSTTIPTEPSGANWADLDDASASVPVKESDEAPRSSAAQSGGTGDSPEKQATTSERRKSLSGLSSPEFGTASSSTLGKEDDVSSVPNASSESTWENKSQASNAIEPSAEQGDEKSGKTEGKKAKKERSVFNMLQEAPLPVVNIWKQRAEARAAQQPSPAKPSVSSGPAPVALPLRAANERPTDPERPGVRRKSRSGPASFERGEQLSNGASVRDREDEKGSAGRREAKSETPAARGLGNGQASKPYEKESKDSVQEPPPSVRNQESWPTPDSAPHEEKKRSTEKGEKKGRERGSSTSSKPHGKNEWVQLAYTPSVVFNTPLPNTSSRRGGRGGSRGGRDAGGRGGSHAVNGASSTEKENAAVGPSSGDQQRRTRSEINSADAAPRAKRTTSAGSTFPRDRETTAEGENPSKAAKADESETPAPRRTAHEEPTPSQSISRTNSLPSQPFASRPRQERNQRRKEGESLSASAEESSEMKASPLNEGQPQQPKSSTFERRSGPFGSLSSRERGEHRPRGGMRNGRGGNAYQHASASGHHYPNGRANSINTPSAYPQSPSSFHPEQHNTFFSQPPHSSRAYRNAGSRSQSIPTDPYYGRVPAGYPAGPQAMAPLQTYMGGIYDYSVVQPMSAVPYSPYVDQYQLLGMVSMQLEYYFSLNNLCKDMYLRKHMDSQGFVFLTVIAEFNRMKHLTTDLELIKYACYQSRDIEFRVGPDGKERIRRREGWEQWVLSIEERDPSARNNGPEDLHYPPVPHPAGFESQYMMQYQASHPASPSSPGYMPNGAPYQSLNGIASPGAQSNGGTAQLANGVTSPEPAAAGRSNPTTSGPGIHPFTPSDPQAEMDSFPNEQIERLTVIVRPHDPATEKPPFPSASSRTFSNGSIDSRSIADEISKFDKRRNSSQTNGNRSLLNDEARNSPESNRTPSPGTLSNTLRSNTSSPNANLQLFWVKDSDRPVNARPENTNDELYSDVREKALAQRSAATDNCPYDMDVLYQFWAHFLIRNFNTSMYDEFRSLAFEDFQNGSDVGMKNLIKYYGHALSSEITIRERIARHYVDLVKWEKPDQDRPAFKQLRSAWRNGALNLKNRKRISNYVDADLRAQLEQ